MISYILKLLHRILISNFSTKLFLLFPTMFCQKYTQEFHHLHYLPTNIQQIHGNRYVPISRFHHPCTIFLNDKLRNDNPSRNSSRNTSLSRKSSPLLIHLHSRTQRLRIPSLITQQLPSSSPATDDTPPPP